MASFVRTETPMVSEARFVGLDPGRQVIEASVRPTGELWTATAGDKGMTEIAATVSDIHPRLIVMQASGNLELPMAGILITLGLPVALVQPHNVRDFARALGRLSRIEPHPSVLLARFGELVQPEASPLPGELVDDLKHLRARRKEIQQMIALERGRAGVMAPALEKDLQAHIQFLERSLDVVDALFSRKVRESRVWH
jgi:transposase